MANESKTILLVDDESDLIADLQDLLTQEGYRVVAAQDGKEALAKLKVTSPHLIILDINMPKMGGISFYHAIARKTDGEPHYPVLVLTGRSNLQTLFKELHVDGFISKPFKISELLHEIQLILERRYGPQPQRPRAESAPLKKILIIENRHDIFRKLGLEFNRQGFSVSGAHSGGEGIERAMREGPDLILIQQALPDFPGDWVASVLKRMPKTMDMALILYTAFNLKLSQPAVQKICEKTGVLDLIESDDGARLLSAAVSFFSNPQPRRAA